MTVTINGTTGIAGVDGSAATPAVQGADTNTGVFYGTDIVAISTGGTERMRVNASGNVGIGTTAASSYGRLAVMTPTSNYGFFGIADSVIGGGGVNMAQYYGTAKVSYIDSTVENGTLGSETARLTFATSNAGTLTERMRIASSGNVGIGTTSPVTTLQVTTSGGAALPATTGTTPSTGELIRLRTGSDAAGGIGTIGLATNQMWIQATDATALGAVYDLLLNPNGGSVGIGTTGNSVLDQVGAGRPLLVSASDTVTTIAGSKASIVIGNSSTTTGNTSQLSFAAITGASANYYASAAINCVFGARTNAQYPTGSLVFSTSSTLNSAPTEKMQIASSGAVTITNLAGVGSRTVTASAAGLLSAASDSRLKQEVTTATIPGLAEVMQLEPKAYKWLDDIEKRGDEAAVEIGFFANDVKDIIPSAAPMGNDGYYGFYDRAVIASLVKAIQEQQAMITALTARITALEATP